MVDDVDSPVPAEGLPGVFLVDINPHITPLRQPRAPVVTWSGIEAPTLVFCVADLVVLGVTDEIIADAFRGAVVAHGVWIVPPADYVLNTKGDGREI